VGRLIAGYGASHTAMMIRTYDPAAADQRRIREAFETVRAEVDELAPDVVVIVSSEHLNSFFYDNFPQVCVGIGDTCTGWGDAGVPAAEVPLATGFASALLDAGVTRGFDLSWSADPRLDHGFMAPLTLIRPELDLPIVPIFQNASTPPLAPFWRSAQLGELIASVVAERPEGERVLLLGAGGLSHWVGTPGMGQVNVEFDDGFLDCVRRGAVDELLTWDVPWVTEEAGNGAQEIRNWVTVMAACPSPGTVTAYEPVTEWATGMALARLF
jgi:protocatechuate 4,5-dioxygenase beta chain/2'-carboxy-2,3-dihydroxybiphenyl 1,2-dioxygenase large subunit/2'-aminobiphenyl-2,3-diol 1,2-dioxygenase large subunit